MAADTFAVALVGRMKHGAIVAGLERKGWTQADLARALGSDPTTVSRICNMSSAPSPAWLTAARQAVFLDVTGQLPDELWPEWYRLPDFLARDKRVQAVAEVPIARLLTGADARRLTAPNDTPEQTAINGELHRDLERAIDGLPKRHRTVLRLHYGLEDGREWDVDEIAAHMGVTASRVRMLRGHGIDRLRKPHRVKRLRHYIEPSYWNPLK